ncbi:hypothetical protein D3C78_1806320 [compost metagenome]
MPVTPPIAITPPMCSIDGAIATGNMNSAAAQFTSMLPKAGTTNHGALASLSKSTTPMKAATM